MTPFRRTICVISLTLISASAFAQSLFIDEGTDAYGISFSYISARKNAFGGSVGVSNEGKVDLGISLIYTRIQESPVVFSPYLGFLPVKQNKYSPPISFCIGAAIEIASERYEYLLDISLSLSSSIGRPEFSIQPIFEFLYYRELLSDGLDGTAYGLGIALSSKVSRRMKLVLTPAMAQLDDGYTGYSIALGFIFL